MESKSLEGQPGQDHRAPAASRLARDEHVAGDALPLERLPDVQPSAGQVDLIPRQPEGLTEAKSGGTEHQPKCAEPISARALDQDAQLLHSQALPSLAAEAWAGRVSPLDYAG